MAADPVALVSPPRVLAREEIVSLDAYRKTGGIDPLTAARNRAPEELVAVIEASGLRGRGGAGFPTGRKWRTVAASDVGAVEPPTVVVNAAEGEPGSYKDRALLARNPYVVLEGALIAAWAVGADGIVVALKASFDVVRKRVERAVEELHAAGLLESVTVSVFAGPGEYLYGEETGLLEVIDGRHPLPRITPPYRHGVEEIVDTPADLDSETTSAAHVELAGPSSDSVGAPTLVNNVETLANIPGIVMRGADWFRELGTDDSPGTLVCTVTGATRRHGIVEVPMGTPMRDVLEAAGGGAAEGRRITAVLSGVSGGVLAGDRLDTPLTHDDMQRAGSALGCGAYIVMDDATDPVAVAEGVARFLSVESCGQCLPCKRDGLALTDLLGRLRRSEAVDVDRLAIDDRLRTVADSARCNLAAQYQEVLGSLLEQFADDFAAHLAGSTAGTDAELVAPIVELDDDGALLEERHADKQPDWTFDTPWSGKAPADLLGEHRGDEDG